MPATRAGQTTYKEEFAMAWCAIGEEFIFLTNGTGWLININVPGYIEAAVPFFFPGTFRNLFSPGLVNKQTLLRIILFYVDEKII